MTRRATTDAPLRITIDRRRLVPVSRQIYDRVRAAILDGALAPGVRLPSARGLAGQLGTARGTVDAAYAMLAGEGYVIGRGPAGTVVAPGLARAATAEAGGASRAPMRADLPAGTDVADAPALFRIDLPALDRFPAKLWSRLAVRTARRYATVDRMLPDAGGEAALRAALVAYLRVARGVAAEPGRLFITAGYRGALGLVAHALIRPGDAVWMEDPGYHWVRRALLAAGAMPVPVAVDDDGIDVAAARRIAPGARLAVVTPANQAPLGVALALPRRLALLDWAEAAGSYVVEDDYDSEFRYVGKPLPALASLDGAGRVIYAGTFSKVLFPALRLGYLAVPDALVDRFREVAGVLHPAPAPLVQAMVASFIEDGHFGRHVHRMRNLYAERRAALLDALRARFGTALAIDVRAGGLHLLVRPRTAIDDRVLEARARAAGLAPLALSRFSATGTAGPGLLLGFTNIPAAAARRHVDRLATALALDGRAGRETGG